jgi:FADH2-dependent halogenase
VKYGAQFHLGNGKKHAKFVFANGAFTREPSAFQVERATFDKILLDHARERDVDVREGWTATKFIADAFGVSVEARGDGGEVRRFHARFLVDASGRSNLTGNQENLRKIHPHMKRVAIFGHFHGVRVDAGASADDTVIVRLENKWFWFIPLGKGKKVSVGLILDKDELAKSTLSPADMFYHTVEASLPVKERMCNATLAGEIRATGDFSYWNTRFYSQRLLRVGDAAGFMDPIFSAGVYMAMYSGKLAAHSIVDALANHHDGTRTFPDYGKRVLRAMKQYWRMVDYFYTPAFIELFLVPGERLQLASTVNALLAGELDGGWTMRWRIHVFFLLVQLQRFVPLAPRIRYD